MEEYIVGKPYPIPDFRGIVNGAAMRISNLGFDVGIFWKNVKLHEVAEFRYGPFTYGLFEKEKVPFITMEFKSMAFDTAVNTLSSPLDSLHAFGDSKANAFRMYLVDADSYLIRGIRVISLNQGFLSELKSVMNEQCQKYQEPKAVDQVIHKLMMKFNTRQMISQARKYKMPGSM